MSKSFGKFLLLSAVAGAAAYGTYYYLQKKEQMPASPADEDVDDDFDDFSEDLDEEIPPVKERTYVSLNLDKAEAIAQEAFQKAKEVIADSVQQVKDTVKSVKENQACGESKGNFTDLTAINKEHAASEEAADEHVSENAPSEPVTEEFISEDIPSESSADEQIVSQEESGEQPAPESSVEKPNVQPSVSTEAVAKEPEGKETANGQVENFFDDTP